MELIADEAQIANRIEMVAITVEKRVTMAIPIEDHEMSKVAAALKGIMIETLIGIPMRLQEMIAPFVGTIEKKELEIMIKTIAAISRMTVVGLIKKVEDRKETMTETIVAILLEIAAVGLIKEKEVIKEITIKTIAAISLEITAVGLIKKTIDMKEIMIEAMIMKRHEVALVVIIKERGTMRLPILLIDTMSPIALSMKGIPITFLEEVPKDLIPPINVQENKEDRTALLMNGIPMHFLEEAPIDLKLPINVQMHKGTRIALKEMNTMTMHPMMRIEIKKI